MDTSVEWDAVTIDDQENGMIAWRSLEGTDVHSAGSVSFEPEEGSGTEVKVTMECNPPGCAVGAAVAKLFGEAPDQQLDEDLGPFKQMMETGEVPSTVSESLNDRYTDRATQCSTSRN